MRTTLRLDPALMKQLKKLAVETNQTLTTVIQDALRESLYRREQNKNRPRVVLPTFKGGKLQPGVDLDDGSALLDIMEGHDPSGR